MSKRSDVILVSDMLEAVERILAYTAGMTFEQYRVQGCVISIFVAPEAVK